MKKKIGTILILCACAAMAAACGKTEKVSDKLIMGTNAEFPPYEFHQMGPNGSEIVGIDVEIAQAIARELNRELEIEDIAFDSILPALQSGKVNIGMAGMTVTEDRLRNVNFSTPYAQASQMIIVREGSEITTPDDLVGKTIGVQLGTTGDIYSEDIEDVTIERYNKGFEAVQALVQGKIDAVIIDSEPAKAFVAAAEGIVVLEEAFTEEEYAIAVAKGDEELLAEINAILVKLTESGEIQEIVDKYITAE